MTDPMNLATLVKTPTTSGEKPRTRAKRVPGTDPRYLRVRQKLITAILNLAAHQPAETIAVSELTAAAGISRTTFYKHSQSPAQFLAEYLIEQLKPAMDPIAHLLEDTSDSYLMRWRQIQLALLDHVAQNRRVYEHVFTSEGQSVVLSMISQYFEGVFEAYVKEFAEHVEGPRPSELWLAMASSQQVHNTIAMLSSWLRTDIDADPDEVIAAYVTLLPPWQVARFSEDGRITLRSAPDPRPLETMGILDRAHLDEESGGGLTLRARERMILGTTTPTKKETAK